ADLAGAAGRRPAPTRRYLDAYRANSVMWALVEQVATIDPEIHRIRLLGRRRHVDRVAKTIRRWQERGLADRGIDPHTTAGALVSMLSNFAYWWLAGGDTYGDEAAARTLTEIWARAVGLRRRPRARRSWGPGCFRYPWRIYVRGRIGDESDLRRCDRQHRRRPRRGRRDPPSSEQLLRRGADPLPGGGVRSGRRPPGVSRHPALLGGPALLCRRRLHDAAVERRHDRHP